MVTLTWTPTKMAIAVRTKCIKGRDAVPLLRALAAIAALALGGCATTLAFTAVPQSAVGRAQVAGYSNIRAWGDAKANVSEFVPNPKSVATPASWRADGRAGSPPGPRYLAISSGSGDGAYSAGVLVGWTKRGDRPAFDLVTGVSTGALAAPFAFLGSAYDKKLKEIYTQFETSDLGAPQIFSAAIGGPSLVDASGLEKLLKYYVTSQLLAEIAHEHARGRRLLVATTNVEAERQVIWNLGAIAASTNANRVDLFRRILLASVAIPAVFPPVLIKVTVDGHEYQEMHADGGVVEHVFSIPVATTAGRRKHGPAKGQLYVLYNGKTSPQWRSIEPTSFKIAARSLGTIIKRQASGDVERLYAQTKSDAMDFRFAAIPDSFDGVSSEPFDKAYMRQLFNLGYSDASRGYRWANAPPW